jgi:hypothetical protein
MTAEMPKSPASWDQPDDELDELAPDSDLLADDLDADPAQTAETDFFWEDDEE